MGRAATFSILGGLTLVGAAAGLHLGRSAVSDIDPVYYGDIDDPRFQSELVPNRSGKSAPPSSSPAELTPVAITSCIGCRAYPEEYRPQRDADIDAQLNDLPASLGYDAVQAAADTVPVAEAPDPEREAVIRYASWPVETVPVAEVAPEDAGISQ